MIRAVLLAASLALGTLPASVTHAQSNAARQLNLDAKPWKGDFDRMLERRMLRVLVPYSRTLYFVDKGRERGLTAERVREFERYLNRRFARQLGKRPLTVYLIVTTREKLLSGLDEGWGDIAAANLTVTDERQKLVDFVAPADSKPVDEVVVTGPASPKITTLDDLSGKTVHVRKSSSYYESVLALNQRLRKAGKEPVEIVELPPALEDEDALEMLNAGLVGILVVDDWKARTWSQVLPKVRIRDDLVLRNDGRIGWAIRKSSPRLAQVVADFFAFDLKSQGGAEGRIAQQQRRVKQINNNAEREEIKRFEATLALFQKYGAKYGFDPLMLAAQGYQESGLRQDARSHVGAIGVMQVMPATGKSLGVGDISQLEPNIHAGVKYLDQLMTRYFPDAKFSPEVRPLFAFAAYNAGPGNIVRMRKLAAKRGLDPDKWFNNVEIVVAEKIGMETTVYVRNIYKYYVAYRLTMEAQSAAAKARKAIGT